MFISFQAIAALPLYWTIGGILLIFQTYLGRKLYFKEVEPQPESAIEDGTKDSKDDEKDSVKDQKKLPGKEKPQQKGTQKDNKSK